MSKKSTFLNASSAHLKYYSALSAIALSLSACDTFDGNSDNKGENYQTVINADVSAANGGDFTSTDGSLMISIPAGALSADTQLVVQEMRSPNSLSDNYETLGDAYEIDLGDATLSSSMKAYFDVNETPEHPELGEVVVMSDGEWMPLAKNFFRSSDETVVALLDASSMVQPVFRTLQSTSGDLVERGRDVFLYESFGNEDFFGGVVGLHEVLNDLSPTTAVGAGVRVDLSKVPQGIVDVLVGDDVDAKTSALQNPAITRALIKAGAVVGVKGVYDDADSDVLTSAGITCALCHVNVANTEFDLGEDELTALPIGALQLNGVPNADIDVGLVLSLTPFAVGAGDATVAFLQSFGPGNFDIRALPDNPLDDEVANPTNNPQLWNFVDLEEQDYLYDWDGLFTSTSAPDNSLASQAEAVYDLVMHANGAFGTASGTLSPELSITPPQSLLDALQAAEDSAPGNVIGEQDLLDVQAWQRSIVSPAPMDYDEAMAEEGFMLFYGEANCGGCHSTPEFTGSPVTQITEDALEGGLAGGIKTPGLRGLAYTAPYFHNGGAATLMDVMDVYEVRLETDLSDSEKAAVVEYMKSL